MRWTMFCFFRGVLLSEVVHGADPGQIYLSEVDTWLSQAIGN